MTFLDQNFGLQATDIFATDPYGANQIQLYDSDGCPMNQKVGALERPDRSKIRAKIEFFGFPDAERVYYKGLVKPCLEECEPVRILLQLKYRNYKRICI